MEAMRQTIDIIKPGTNTLVVKQEEVPTGLDKDVFQSVSRQVKTSTRTDPKIVIVSSGAIAAGMLEAGATVRPGKDTEEGMTQLQRFASIGWRILHNAWDKSMSGIVTGGVLLTEQALDPQDEGHRQERSEALRVIRALLDNGEVPIVNENDAIAHEEISFGDNDILAARLAVNIARSALFEGNVRLFLLSNTNGVYEDMTDPDTRIPVIHNTDQYRHLALGTDSVNSSGGMRSKFDAADIAHAAGIDMWLYDPRIGNGHRGLAISGETGTYFPAPDLSLSAGFVPGNALANDTIS